MVRLEAFHQLAALILSSWSLRIRSCVYGYAVLDGNCCRIDAEISVHDMAFGLHSGSGGVGIQDRPWPSHTKRCLHSAGPERYCVRSVRSSVFWGIAVPLLILGLAWLTHSASLLLSLVYPLQAMRIALRNRASGMTSRDAWLFGWFCSIARIPHAIGVLDFWIERFLNLSKKDRVITYK